MVNWTRTLTREAKSRTNWQAVLPSRVPTSHDGISLLSASMAVHVQTSPTQNLPFMVPETFFATPVIRTVERMEQSSTKAETTAHRFWLYEPVHTDHYAYPNFNIQ